VHCQRHLLRRLQVSKRKLGIVAVAITALVVEFIEPIPKLVIWRSSQLKYRQSCPEGSFPDTSSIVLQRRTEDVLAQIQQDGEVTRLSRSIHRLQLID
jgi:hypothetical protein